MPLTDTKLRALLGKVTDATIEYPDREGLVAVAGKSGKVSWVFRYRYKGQSKRLTFGSYPAFSLLEARERSYELRRAVEDGQDPKQKDLPESQPITLEQCSQQWLSHYVSTLATNTQALYQSNANKYFTLERFPHDVETARFEQWIAYFDAISRESSKHNAGHMLKTIKSMLNWCKRRRFIHKSVLFEIDLRAVGEKPNVGQRTLEMNEVAKLWIEITRSKATPAIKAALKLLIIFGARNTEVRQASYAEFDFDNLVWTIPKERSKSRKIIRRPIPRLAKDIIRELQISYGSEGYLIPGERRDSSMTAYSLNRFCGRMWGKLHTEFKTDKFIPHDLRRTISTRLSENGILPHVTEKMLGHELQGIMAVYNKHDWLEDQRLAYELWCDLIEAAIQREQASRNKTQ